jgi:hypothetical protein
MADKQPPKTIWAVRYGIPGALALAGVVILAIKQSTSGVEAFGMFIGAAGAVLLLNGLYRLGAGGDGERDVEESARDYYDAHGEWPATATANGRDWALPAGVVTFEAERRAAEAVAGPVPAQADRPAGD